MKLRDIARKLFGRGPATDFRSSTTPTGTVNHRLYDEDENHTYRWQTHNHPVYLEMQKTEFGSFNMVQYMKTGWRWKKQTVREYLSEDKAAELLMGREIDTLRAFGGYGQKLTYGDIRVKVQGGGYPANHIFTYMKTRPDAFARWEAGEAAKQAPEQKQSPRRQSAPAA